MTTGVLVSIFLLLSSTVSLGSLSLPTSTTQQTDCRLSPNPDECYHNKSQQQWSPYNPSLTSVLPPLNTDTLGLSGPVSADVKFDADLDWILGLKYLRMFGESAGLAAKLTGGPNEFRTNVTTGYAFTRDHQIKVTYEYLTQNLPFNFASGEIREWVAQHSAGAAYQYVIRGEILHSLELSGYITRANSKDLENMAFNQQAIPGGFSYDMNFRHIAGGRENTVLASANLKPFANDRTTLILGAGYSDIRYDTIFESNQAANRPAFKAELEHLLSPKAKVIAGTVGSAASIENTVGFSYLLPKHFEASVKGQYTMGQATLPDNKSVTLGLTYPAGSSYSLSSFGDVEALRTWIDKPVIYAQRVLAIKDELVKRYEFTNCNSPLANQLKHWGDFLTPVPTSTAFCFTDPSIQVTYTFTAVQTSGSGTIGTDYGSVLDLALVSTGPNQATLESTAGMPEFLDAEESISSAGTYQVTITATASIPNAPPITVTNQFVLTVQGNPPPVWPNPKIPDAFMGFVYPNPADSNFALADLTAQVTPGGTDGSVDFAIEPGPGCTTPPDWLGISLCAPPNNPTHFCLRTSDSVVVPNDVNITNFCVRITARGQPSGSPLTQVLTAAVIQVPPVWTLPSPTPTREFNDTTPINLVSYITSGTQDLAFQPGDGFDTDHWTLTSTGELALKAPGDPNFLGLKEVPVIATNSTSFFEGVLQLVPVIVQNTALVVGWTSADISPEPVVARPYSQPLNPMALVATAGDPSDTYTYALVSGSSSDPNWVVVDANGVPVTTPATPVKPLTGLKLQYKDGVTPIPATGTVTLTLAAQSDNSGNLPSVNANGANPPDFSTKTFTFNINPNPDLAVGWTGNGLTAAEAQGTYSHDLNGMNLLETTDGSTPLIDTYTFAIATDAVSDPNWTVTPDGKTLQFQNGTGRLPAVGTKFTIVLTAKSDNYSTPTDPLVPSSGGDPTPPPDSHNKTFELTVGENPNLTVGWKAINTLPDAKVGEAYDKPLNYSLLDPQRLLDTKDGATPVDDQYKFRRVNQPTDVNADNWNVVPDTTDPNNPQGLRLQYKDGTVPVPTAGTVTLTLAAVSDNSGKLPTSGGNATPLPASSTKTFTFTINQNPALGVLWTTDELTPATIGQPYKEALNDMTLLATSTLPDDTYHFTRISTTDPNWIVVDENGVPVTTLTPPFAGLTLQYGDGNTPVAPLNPGDTTVTLILDATSDNTGNQATNGNVPTQPSPKTQKSFTLQIAPDSTRTVAWTSSTLEPAKILALYDKPLNRPFTNPPNPDPTKAPLLETRTALDVPVDDQYKFTLLAGGTPGWRLDPNTTDQGLNLQYVGAGTTPIPIPASLLNTTVTLTLAAISTSSGNRPTSGGNPTPLPPSSTKTFTFTIGVNPDLVVGWTNNSLTGAQVLTTYKKELNPMALLETTNGSDPVPNDSYTFALAPGSTADWNVVLSLLDPTPANPANPNGLVLQYKNGATKIPTSLFGTTVTIVLTAKSVFSGEFPSSGGNPPDSHTKTFTFTIGPNPNLTVGWTSNLLKRPVLLVAYNQPLNVTTAADPQDRPLGYTPNLTPLLQTLDAGVPVPGDTYKFARVFSSDTNWNVSPSSASTQPADLRGLRLLFDNGEPTTLVPPPPRTETITLTAVSVFSGNQATSGGDTGNQQNKTFNLVINPNPTLNPAWTGNNGDLLPAASADQTYPPLEMNNLDLLPTPLLPLVQTPTDSADQYTFTIVPNGVSCLPVSAPSCGTWNVVASDIPANDGIVSKLVSVGSVPAGLTQVKIRFTAQSRDSQNFATNGNISTTVRELTIPVANIPVFNPVPRAIKFDTTGDANSGLMPVDPALGNIEDGILLNTMVPNAGTFTNLTFNLASPQPNPDVWQIRQGTGANSQKYYLLRKLTGTHAGTQADPYQIDATGVNGMVPVSIEACTTDNAPPGKPICSQSAFVDVTVNPDRLIQYLNAADPITPSFSPLSATSNGQGGDAMIASNDNTPINGGNGSGAPPPQPTMSRFTRDTLITQVIKDPAASFLPPNGNARQYVNYPALRYKTPNSASFMSLVALGDAGDTTYLNAQSPANGNDNANPLVPLGNIINLQPIVAGELVLVPFQSTVNPTSGFTPGNRGPNIGVGINALSNPCDPSDGHSTITALAFNLSAPPAGKQYFLTQAPNTVGAGTPRLGLCFNASSPLLPVRSDYQGASFANSGDACGRSNSAAQGGGTWDATGISGAGASRCTGGTNLGDVTTFPKLMGAAGGFYTLYLTTTAGLNQGVMAWFSPPPFQNPPRALPDIPTIYFDPNTGNNMLTRPTDQKAPMLGQNYTTYLDFPRIKVQ